MGSLTDCLSAGYFSTLGTPLVTGREFTDADREDSPPIAMVNEAFAREYLGSNALGRRVRFSPGRPWKEIVGVVRNTTWDDAREKPGPFVFVPIPQAAQELGALEWYVRSRSGYQPAADIRRVIHGLDPNVPVNALQETRPRSPRQRICSGSLPSWRASSAAWRHCLRASACTG